MRLVCACDWVYRITSFAKHIIDIDEIGLSIGFEMSDRETLDSTFYMYELPQVLDYWWGKKNKVQRNLLKT